LFYIFVGSQNLLFDRMPRNKRLHFKDIHGLRAIAFFPIYFYCILSLINEKNSGILFESIHFIEKITQSSFDFFFFLSSFLLTSHALREYKYLDSFSLKNFFIRRVLRLISVLILGLIFAFFLHPWLVSVLDLHAIALPVGSNFAFLVPNYLSTFQGDQLIYLKIISSIYMFIQFYLIWGIILKYLVRYIKPIAFLLVIIGIIIRIIHSAGGVSFSLDTLAYGIPIGIGVLTAAAIRNDSKIVKIVKTFSKRINITLYVIGIFLFLLGYILMENYYFAALIPLFTSLFFGFLMIEQTFGENSFVQLKNYKILSYLGKISYGMIVYQAIIGVLIMIAMESLDFDSTSVYTIVLIVLAGFIGTMVISDLSFKLFEKPLIRIRREFKKI